MKFPISLLLSLSIFACGEKEEEEEVEEDFSMYCGEDSTQNLIADDADCDGAVTADDCDDEDDASTIVADDGDCDTFLTADDCDDEDAASTIVADDGDCDTHLTADDCDDADATSTIVADDGDCDGTLTADDCDDEDDTSTIVADDGDCDTHLTADDCDDANAESTIVADDGDCDTSLTADDCDDANPYAYPGTGQNEAIQSDDTCYSDMDGDGFGDANTLSHSHLTGCYLLEMTDTYGDGWNGNEIEVMEDGVSTGIYSNDNSYDADESKWETHCLAPDTSAVDFVFLDGSFNSEVEFTLYYDDGIGGELVAAGVGYSSSDFIFDEVTYTDGDTFYSEATPLPYSTLIEIYGTDCDDADATIHPGIDIDGDSFNACDDCDDSNQDINPGVDEEYYDGIDSNCDGMSDYDMDMDGYDSIQYTGACSDITLMNQWDCEDVGTCSDATLGGQTDCEDVGTCSDTTLMDQTDCEDAAATWTMTNTWTSAGNTWTTTGSDCMDDEEIVHPLAMEADPNACYIDDDDDGYGYSTLDAEELDMMAEWGLTNGTDCNDYDADMLPGYDFDADGADSCNDCNDTDDQVIGQAAYMDADADGFGAGSEMWVCELDEDADGTDDYSLVGTDCDDDNAYLNPADTDTDGYATCEDVNGLSDCDDDDATTYPGAGFMEAGFDSTDYSTYECLTDGDGDGYGYGMSSTCYMIDMVDSWGDGWNGNEILISVNGIDELTATISSGDTGMAEVCVEDGDVVTMTFLSGSFTGEISGTVYGTDGGELGTFDGTSGQSWNGTPATLNFSDGMSYGDNEVFLEDIAIEQVIGGSDSDDSDSTVW